MAASRTPKPTINQAMAQVGQRIRERRTEVGLSLERLAEQTSMHWSYIGRLERGHVNPALASLLQLADQLDIDIAELVQGVHLDAERS